MTRRNNCEYGKLVPARSTAPGLEGFVAAPSGARRPISTAAYQRLADAGRRRL
jgi:hypothetical protein